MPVLWGVIGYVFAALANPIFHDLAIYSGKPWVAHGDEVFIGVLFAVMRFARGEWHFEQVYASHKAERRVGNALQILRDSTDEHAKADALQIIVGALEDARPFHPDWRRK